MLYVLNTVLFSNGPIVPITGSSKYDAWVGLQLWSAEDKIFSSHFFQLLNNLSDSHYILYCSR
jgi:hypothetical protein